MAGPRQQGQKGPDRDLAQAQLAGPLLALPVAPGDQRKLGGSRGLGGTAGQGASGGAAGWLLRDWAQQAALDREIEAPAL